MTVIFDCMFFDINLQNNSYTVLIKLLENKYYYIILYINQPLKIYKKANKINKTKSEEFKKKIEKILNK